MKNYITSDLHFYHKNIIDYCNREKYIPSSDESCLQMNQDILKKINKQVPDEKGVTLWNLGDFFYGPLFIAQSLETIQKLVQNMKGKHRKLNLVLGNHDKEVKRYADWNRWAVIKDMNLIQIFTFFGFDEVYTKPVFFDNNIILSHEPFHLKPDSPHKNIHGHTHNFDVDKKYFAVDLENAKMVLKAYEISGRQLPPCHEKVDMDQWIVDPNMYKNVCWDANKEKVLDLDDLVRRIK